MRHHKSIQTISILVAASMLLPALFIGAPVYAARPSSSFAVPQMYANFFYWFGDNGFNTNVTFGSWSNCPVASGWLPSGYPTTNAECLATTASGNNAFVNSGWDSNIACTPNPSTAPCQSFTLEGNTLIATNIACFVNDQFAVLGCISMMFHHEKNTSNVEEWIANPENPQNSLTLNSSGVVIGSITMGGYLNFAGPPSASTFVKASLQEWSYRTPSFYAMHKSTLSDAVYAPSAQGYLVLTGIWDLSAAPLSTAQMTALIGSTQYLPAAPQGQSYLD
ncbi:MAG: hypothetical protein JRN59_07165 [Nitrososphaerota archaeon]|nr:hypothetical protein [Nitrososphaerota archaeon]